MNSEDARLEAMESKLTFQEDALQQLNEALIEQQARIHRLEAMVRTLSEHLHTQPHDAADIPEPPPPHY